MSTEMREMLEARLSELRTRASSLDAICNWAGWATTPQQKHARELHAANTRQRVAIVRKLEVMR